MGVVCVDRARRGAAVTISDEGELMIAIECLFPLALRVL